MAAIGPFPIGLFLPWLLPIGYLLTSYFMNCRGEPAGRGRFVRGAWVLGLSLLAIWGVAEFVAVWDNSADNPLNPDPTAWCGWGKKTTDEMYGGAIFYIPKQKLPHPIRVENGRSARART